MVGRHVRTRAGVWGAIARDRRTRSEEEGIERRALELLEYVGVAARANELAKGLPYGDQRRLEIARALATEPQAPRARRAGRGDERDRDAVARGAARTTSAATARRSC